MLNRRKSFLSTIFFSLLLFVVSMNSGYAQCDTPANLNSVTMGSGSSINTADLSWDAVAGAVFYTVLYRIDGTPSYSAKVVTTNSTTLSGLPPSTLYEWTVRAICSAAWDNNSELAGIETFTTGTGIECNAVTNFQVASNTSTSADLTWTAATGAIQYYIQYRIPEEQSWDNADFIFTLQPSSKTINGLQENKNYEVRMRTICAIDGGVWTSFSDYSSIETFDTFTCETPTNINITPGFVTADVTWDAAPVSNRYQLRWRETGSPTYNNNLEVVGVTNATITGLDPNTQYDFIMRNRCSPGNSPNSPYTDIINFTTVDGATCDTPGSLGSTPSVSTVDLTWAAAPGAIDYRIKYRETGSPTYDFSVTTTNTSITITGLTNNTQYDWIIRTQCAAENSDYSTVQNFTTLPGLSCDTPVNGMATPAATTALVTWDNVALADEYQVKWRVNGNPTYTNSLTTSVNSATLTLLTPNTTYDWIVRSICPSENSAYTTAMNFTTLSSGIAGRVLNNSTVVIEEELEEISEFNLEVFPNPTYGKFTVRTGSDGRSDVMIIDTYGREVASNSFEGVKEFSYDLRYHPAGIYFIRVRNSNRVLTERVLLK